MDSRIAGPMRRSPVGGTTGRQGEESQQFRAAQRLYSARRPSPFTRMPREIQIRRWRFGVSCQQRSAYSLGKAWRGRTTRAPPATRCNAAGNPSGCCRSRRGCAGRAAPARARKPTRQWACWAACRLPASAGSAAARVIQRRRGSWAPSTRPSRGRWRACRAGRTGYSRRLSLQVSERACMRPRHVVTLVSI